MARKRVNLAYIRNAAKRKAAFKKRKIGLLKKISEITTLCGIEACAIIYSPDEAEPTVWPSEEGANDVLSRFKGASEVEQTKKMLCQETLVRKNIMKAQSQLQKLRTENRKKEITLFLYQYLAVGEKFLLDNIMNADIIDLNDIAFLTDKKLEEIKTLLEKHKKQEVTPGGENGSGDEAMTQASENESESETNVDETNVDETNVDETNVDDAMQDVNWPVDNINADDEDENGMLTLDNVNVQSGWLNHFLR